MTIMFFVTFYISEIIPQASKYFEERIFFEILFWSTFATIQLCLCQRVLAMLPVYTSEFIFLFIKPRQHLPAYFCKQSLSTAVGRRVLEFGLIQAHLVTFSRDFTLTAPNYNTAVLHYAKPAIPPNLVIYQVKQVRIIILTITRF